MPFDDQTYAKVGGKVAQGLSHTSNVREFDGESILSGPIIDSSKANHIDGVSNSQAIAVGASIVEVITFDFTEVIGTNGLAYEANFPVGYSGAFGTGAIGNLLRDYTFAIPKTYSSPILSINSDGYNPEVKNGSAEVIPAGDIAFWYWDSRAGVVTAEVNGGGSSKWPPSTIKCAIYIGELLSDHIAHVANPHGVTYLQTGGAGAYRLVFTNAALASGVLTVTHSLGQKFCVVQVYNGSDKAMTPDEIELTSTTQCKVYLNSLGVIVGTWNVVVVG